MPELAVAIIAGVVGAVVGALAAAAAAFGLYKKQRADDLRDQSNLDAASGELARREAVIEQFKCAYSAKTWLSRLPSWVNAPDSPARSSDIREEAMKRSNHCHEVWDYKHIQIDVLEVQSAMFVLDKELSAVLGQVTDGNLSPDLSALNESLQALKDTAYRRLGARI